MAAILVVEDEVDLCNLIRTKLEAEGHSVFQAFDGPAALRMVEVYRPHLVILDWMLPGLDGLAVCRQLRQTYLMPIIMLTARTEEIDRVLAGRLPTVADVDRLPYTTRVVTESMRLYPPAWLVGRRAVNEYSIGGYYVPPRSIVVMSQWIVHRDPRHYPAPERFDPDRWTPAFKAALPRFAYFPFGGGPRQCIGESFAWMELVLVLATIAQHWRFDLVPGHPVVPHAAVTLRPKYGMKMTARKRLVVGG